MRKKKEMQTNEAKPGISVSIQIDVTKVVKYSCLCAVSIVGIICGTGAWLKSMKYH